MNREKILSTAMRRSLKRIDWNCRPRFGLRTKYDWKGWSPTRHLNWIKRTRWEKKERDISLGSYIHQLWDSGRYPRDI